MLRLIRNTADFPGIVYIVAYDKGYVAAPLTNRGIRKADIYLEKIFKSKSSSIPWVFSSEKSIKKESYISATL